MVQGCPIEGEKVIMPKAVKKNLQPNVLITSAKYAGMYVAFSRQEKDRAIVASGRNVSVVVRKAREQGVEEPVIVHVPKKDHICAY